MRLCSYKLILRLGLSPVLLAPSRKQRKGRKHIFCSCSQRGAEQLQKFLISIFTKLLSLVLLNFKCTTVIIVIIISMEILGEPREKMQLVK